MKIELHPEVPDCMAAWRASLGDVNRKLTAANFSLVAEKGNDDAEARRILR